jgi:hypothetical protein
MTNCRYFTAMAGALTLMALPFSTMAFAQISKPAAAMQYIAEQPQGEWLAHVFFGAKVQGVSGEVIGDINDLVFTHSGQISTVVIGVGGFLGMGEKDVAVPFSALSFKSGPDGARVIVVALSKDDLTAAPSFKATEKTTYDAMKDKAIALGQKASEKAGQLKDQAMKKVEDMKADTPKKP